jgi:hypothetical protein
MKYPTYLSTENGRYPSFFAGSACTKKAIPFHVQIRGENMQDRIAEQPVENSFQHFQKNNLRIFII